MSNQVLRLITCGSAGDGKTALVERLVAGSTQRRPLIIAEVPEGEEGTRAMISGASSASLAIIVVDARKGVLAQTRRDSYLAALLGVRRVVLAVNKMDLVGYSAETFTRIEESYRQFASKLGLEQIHCIPVSAALGDNVVEAKASMPSYAGPTLMEVLEATPIDDRLGAGPPRDGPPATADQFEATIIWMAQAPLLPGRNYLMKHGGRTVAATVAPLRYKVNVDTLEHVAAERLLPGEIGVAQLELDQPIAFEPYAQNRELGSFSLIDPIGHHGVGAGLLHFDLRRSHNVHWQAVDLDRNARAALKGQRPCVLWFTGLSGAGKSTIANLVEKRLHALGRHTYLLDGDNVRHGLNKDLGFTEQARVENIRRVAEVAKLMADAGLIVLAAFISPFRGERRMARALMPPGEFIEVFVDVPLSVAEQRDPKGLYRKARRGELKNFTGIDSPYEPPERAEIRIDSARLGQDEAASAVVDYLLGRGF